MIRELRRRLLLRAHSAARRKIKLDDPDFYDPRDAFVAGWLAGHRTARLDFKKTLMANHQHGSFK